MINKVECMIDGQPLTLEAGRVARQADGAVLVQYGETIVLVSVVATDEPDYERGYLPLFCDYREKSYAAGKIPGGFFKREGRPSEKETLTARLIDRPLRPFFPEGYFHEVQIMATVLSYDQENDPDVLSVIGASAALAISDIPFPARLGAVRVGMNAEGYIVNPTCPQLEESSLDITVVGTRDSVVMVEGSSLEVSEDVMIGAIREAQKTIAAIIDIQEELRSKCGREKKSYSPPPVDSELIDRIREKSVTPVEEALSIREKEGRRERLKEIIKKLTAELEDEAPDVDKAVRLVVDDVGRRVMRSMILKDGKRIDGRGLDEIRPITCEIGVLPRTHGSAIFTRGQTQALAVVTLGTSSDQQRVDSIQGESSKSFMLHYNFPPYSVGEVRMIRGPARREIGHGALAERALKSTIPAGAEFPYTIRIVADIMESNGSSSMATVCSGSLSLMDAGAPVKAAVAGIAMGLVKEGDDVAILTDILGDEDKLGDMDFKVTGTREGITAFQMDIKIEGISYEIMEQALRKARAARLSILDIMGKTISEPRSNLSEFAPSIISMMVPKDRIGDIIGPGGQMIRSIVEVTCATR